MLERVKNQIFGRFIEFGWFYWSDIAYSDRGNRSLATDSNQCSGNLLNLCIIITILGT